MSHVFDNEEHFMMCAICYEVFDRRDLSEVFKHEHNSSLPILEHHYFGTKKQDDKTSNELKEGEDGLL